MLRRGNVVTFYVDGKWRNRVESVYMLPDLYDSKESAVDAGNAEARRREVQHVVHDFDDGALGCAVDAAPVASDVPQPRMDI